jgi:hypothetical protein
MNDVYPAVSIRLRGPFRAEHDLHLGREDQPDHLEERMVSDGHQESPLVVANRQRPDKLQKLILRLDVEFQGYE